MSQHNLQQWLHPDTKFAPSERPKRRRPIAAMHKPVIAALALTASFIAVAFVHVTAYARLAALEYRRQALVAQARCLEAANAQLRFELGRARAQERIAAIASARGMVLADPASQVDYIVMPVVAAAPARAGDVLPGLRALLRDFSLAQQVTSVITTGWGNAVQTAAANQPAAPP